MFVILPYIYC